MNKAPRAVAGMVVVSVEGGAVVAAVPDATAHERPPAPQRGRRRVPPAGPFFDNQAPPPGGVCNEKNIPPMESLNISEVDGG